MDIRSAQAPLMPTLPPPLGLGLPPPHLGLPPHQLTLPFQQPGGHSGQSLPSSPSPVRGHLAQPPLQSPANSKSTFAAALRDLAKNAVDPQETPGLQRRVSTPVNSGPPASPAPSSLLDVRKGFGRPGDSLQRSTPAPPSSSSPSSLTQDHGVNMGPGGFQPYRSHLGPPPPPPPPGSLGGFHPSMFPGMPPMYGPESDPLYQAQMTRYLATLQSMGVPSLGSLPPGLHPYPGHSMPPALLAGYPPELLQAYGLGQLPPSSTAEMVARMQENKQRAEEGRRMEMERRDLARAREAGRDRASPSVKKSSSDGRDHPSLLKLSKISSPTPGLQRLQPSVPGDIKLPTSPLDISEIRAVSPSDSVKSASPSPSSPSPPPDPNYTVSRCRPYVPKSRAKLAKLSDDPSVSASTPRKMFVRPFEDDYSPIHPASDHLDMSGSSLSPDKECKPSNTNVDLDDIVKPDDQDSDYESMSSDSSIKKEGSLLCPSSGQLLSELSEEPVPVFREPDSDIATQKDKLKYLRYFRLVTHRKKNDIEIKKLERRRERLRERSPSPLPVREEERPSSPELPLPSIAPHLNRLPETHAKAMYLSAIGLCRNSEEQKITNEIIWSVVLDDRLTRERESERALTKYFVRLREVTDQQSQEVLGRGVKRSWEESFLPPSQPVEQPEPRAQLNIPSSETVRETAMVRLGTESPSPSEVNLCSLQPLAKPSLLLQEVKSEPGTGQAPPAHLQPHLPVSKVLPTSPYKMEVKTEPEDLSVLSVVRKKKQTSSLAWPGVEAILESYKKFTADCEQEKSLLQEKLSRAQQEVVAKRGQVDNLSTRLSSLARLHKTLVGNHSHSTTSLDTLRTQLVAISKLVSANK